MNLKDEDVIASQSKQGDLKARDASKLAADQKERQAEITRLEAELKTLRDQEQALRLNSRKPGISKAEGEEMRRKAAEKHSPPIPIEMTFNIYRTTKGVLGEPVLASMIATNGFPLRAGSKPHPDLFPIREYYTNKRSIPSSLLVGSHGFLTIEVRCVTPNQYLGMAEGDLYILSSEGDFWVNYVKGLFGIWLRALVLTSIGLFAGTFLSWPVAMLTTIAFFFFGELAFNFLALFSLQLEGGGPFESMIRILNHQNMVNQLAPTPAVIVAKTFDAIVMPVMGRLVYLVPNFGALDVTNTVAEGFAIQGGRSCSSSCSASATRSPSRSQPTSSSRIARWPHEHAYSDLFRRHDLGRKATSIALRRAHRPDLRCHVALQRVGLQDQEGQ